MRDYTEVRIGEFALARGAEKLLTRDLGSCVGIAMWDPGTSRGALLHIMLPACPVQAPAETHAKYADTGLELLVQALVRQGAVASRLVCKIAGAAHVVELPGLAQGEDISSRNLRAVRKKLRELQIPILAEEVEDKIPRTMLFAPADGRVLLKTAGRPDRWL